MKCLIPMIILVSMISCTSINYVEKTVIDARDGIQKTIKVPDNCDDYSDGLKLSIDAMVKYGKEEASFNAIYNKINIIEQFSSRIKAITTAQCKINQNSITIDSRIPDQILFTDLIRKSFEYQKLKDALESDISMVQKDKISSALIEVYTSIYNNKQDELIGTLSDLEVRINAREGSTITITINDETISSTNSNSEGYAIIRINKKYLIEKPNEITVVGITTSIPGYETSKMMLSISELYKYKI